MAGTTLCNCFDGIANGTTVTTGNSGAASGAAFDTLTIGTGATLAGSTTHTAHNGSSLKVATSATAASSFVQWGTSLGTVSTCYFRVYGYFTANPSATTGIARFAASSGFAGAFQVSTTGHVLFIDSGSVTQLTSTNAIPLNTWWRLEGFITGSATVGKAQFKCFFGGLDTTTATETQTSPATLNTAGQVTNVRFGQSASLSNIGPYWIDDIGVTTSGYLGPSYSAACRVGASVFNSFYGSSQTAKNTAWDNILGRDFASPPNGVMRRYYSEGDDPSADGQNVVGLAGSGVKCCITFRPYRDGTNNYTGTVPGQTITYAQVFAQIQAALQLYFDNGIKATQIEVVLWHEANLFGKNGPFGTGSSDNFPNVYTSVTTDTQAAANYAAYVQFYGQAVSQFGVKLTYVPSLASNGIVASFYPGTVNSALAPYFSTVAADFYWSNSTTGGGNATLANSSSLASTQGLKLAMWEWAIPVDGSVAVTTVVNYITGSAAAGGQILQVFQAFRQAGGVLGDLVWFNGASGGTSASDNIKTTTDSRILTAMHTVYDSLAGPVAAVTMQGTFHLTASGQDVSGTTKFGAANLAGSFTLTAAGTAALKPAAAMTGIFTLITAGGPASFIVQQANGVASFDYGASTIEMTTTGGNMLVVLAGWDLSTAPVTAPMPAVNVSDSAGNYWVHAGHSTAGITATRSAAWVCVNAQPIEWLSVSLTTFASSMAYTVLEVSGAPSHLSFDAVAANGQASAPSLALNPGTATGQDFAFSVYAIGSLSPAQPALPGWNPLTTVAAAGTSVTTSVSRGGLPPGVIGEIVPATVTTPVNPVQIFPYFQTATAGQSLATSFSIGVTPVPYSGVTFAIRSNVSPPYQPDPGFPVLKVELGLGSTPGDPSQPPPQWTDITQRCMSKDGDQFIQISMGRAYELGTPEAGTITVAAYNGDGALTPGGANALPGLALEAPLRVSAYWGGSWYAIGYAWVERFPQEWPDLPQWGMSRMVATDAISVMAAVNMVSAMDAETLLDAPYVLLPLGEQYLSFSNGLNSFGGSGFAALGYYSAADAQGLPAQNVSRVNQRAGMYVDGQGNVPGGTSPAIAQTGMTTNLLGTAGTGFGTSSIGTGTAPTAPLSGPGLVYTDPAMPDPLSAGGVTVSFWVIVSSAVTSAALQPTVFTAYGLPTSYPAAHGALSVQIMNFTGGNTLKVTLADGSSVTAPFNVSSSPQRITLCITSASLSVYVNGALGVTTALTAAQTTAWAAVSLGGPNYAYGSGGTVPGNFTAFGLAVHACQLPVQRIVSEYNTGISGQQNAGAITRLAQILSWAGLGIARGGRQTFNGASQDTLQGPAYNVGGANAAAAAGQVVANENGMLAAQPTGEVEFIHRWALLNQDPVVTFGDNPDPAAGEIPYQPAQSWGYDNQYLVNVAQTSQQYGPNVLFTAVGADLASEQQYFPRAGQQQTIQTMSALDAADNVNWSLGKYAQPGLRVAALTVNAAASPALAFPAVLALRQGQVATVIRRPAGAPPIQQNCVVQKIQHNIGGKTWQTSYQLSPYDLEAAVLQLDVDGNDVVGNNALA